MFLDENRDRIVSPFSIFFIHKKQERISSFPFKSEYQKKKMLHPKEDVRGRSEVYFSIMGIQTA